MQTKIYYHHTDCGGVVYYAKYLEFLEEARTEYLSGKGVFLREFAKLGTLFVVARQEIDYKLPAHYGDVLDIDTKVTNVSGVRIEFDYEIKNQDKKIICLAKTLLVCVDKNFKPQAIPQEVKESLS